MGNSESSHTTQSTGGTGPNVFLNVYIPTQNAQRGVYHTGIELCGVEYAYGGGSVSSSGVYKQTPKEDPPGEQWKFHQQLDLGKAKISDPKKAAAAVVSLGDQFPADSYHLTQNNCNHFTNAAAKVLGVAVNYPDYINRMANMGATFGVGGEFKGEKVKVEETKTVFETTQGHKLDDDGDGDGKDKKPVPIDPRTGKPNPWLNKK